MRITEQTKQENRARILEKAAELFCSKGFDLPTTREIAQAAGLASGTVFNYFPSKETLAMTMVTEALREGRTEYLSRLNGDEDLNEELYLFISSGLRRLHPMRPFLGPVLERSLSPFPRKNVCQEGETARMEHLETVQAILAKHHFDPAPDSVLLTIYWSLYLGILACWTCDESYGQEQSRALIDYSLRFFVQTISGNQEDNDAA